MSELALQEKTPQNVGLFTPRQLKFIAKYSKRDLSQDKIDIGKSIGVSERTIYRWFNNPKFVQKVNDLSLAYVIKHTSDVDKKVLQKAINDGDIQAIKLFYQRAGVLDDKPTTQNNTQVNINFDQSDLETILHNTRHLRKSRQDNNLQ